MIKAVIFDMDGLMFDTESAYTKVHEIMSQRRRRTFNAEIKSRLMGKRASEVMQLLSFEWEESEAVDVLLNEQDELLTALYRDSVSVLPGLRELLLFLKQSDVRACVGTSSRRFLVDILLTRHKLQDAFEFVVSGDLVSRGKPHPDIFNLCLSSLEMTGKETLVLEDSQNGVIAAKSAKCNVIAVPSIHTAHEDFSQADAVVTTLSDRKIITFLERG